MLDGVHSLTSTSHSDRREPRRGCCRLTEKSEGRGTWRQRQGVAWDKLPLPVAPLVASLVGTLRV